MKASELRARSSDELSKELNDLLKARFGLRSKLKTDTKNIIRDKSNLVFLSIISAWEITIKVMLKKLQLDIPLNKIFKNLEYEILPLKLDHMLVLLELPPIHKDPFDRMLVAQAKSEKLTLLSEDPKIKQYQSK